MDEEISHEFSIGDRSPHWPGKSCFCQPEVVPFEAPCGHEGEVIIHIPNSLRPTMAQKEAIVRKCLRLFRLHHE